MSTDLDALVDDGSALAVTPGDVRAARARLGTQVRQTPVMRIEADQLGGPHPAVWLKLESLQATGAFKARGALNNLLAGDIPVAGVCAASGGNHGQAVAWAARGLGVRAAVFVPITCPAIKLRRLQDYGAIVTVVGSAYDESFRCAAAYAAATGALLVHPFDQPLTVAGAGTVAAEFIEQVPDLDTVLVAVGGGGLLAGSAIALTGTATRVVGVEPLTARCLGAALEAGEPVQVAVSGAAVDSLGPQKVGRIGYQTAMAHHVLRVEVSDQDIRTAQLIAWEELRIGLEGGGGAALAAILSGAYQPAPDEVIGVVCSGGNVDITTGVLQLRGATAQCQGRVD